METWMTMIRLAGCVGVSPDDFSLVELFEMSKAKDMQNWRHTMSLFCSSFQPKPMTFKTFYPYHDERKKTKTKEGFEIEVKTLESFVNVRNKNRL